MVASRLHHGAQRRSKRNPLLIPMKLSDEDQKNHPQLTQYVRYALPQVANVGVIAKAMHEHGLLSLDEFKKALKWGEAPTLLILDSSKTPCGSVNSWYGCSRNDTEIEID